MFSESICFYNKHFNNKLIEIFEPYGPSFINTLKKSNSTIYGDLITHVLFNTAKINVINICVSKHKSFIIKNWFDNFVNNKSEETLSTIKCDKQLTYLYISNNNITTKINLQILNCEYYNITKYLITNSFLDIDCINYNGNYLFYKKDHLDKKITMNIDYLKITNLKNCYNISKIIKKNNYEITNENEFIKKFSTFTLPFEKFWDCNFIEFYYNGEIIIIETNNLNIDNLFKFPLHIIDFLINKISCGKLNFY